MEVSPSSANLAHTCLNSSSAGFSVGNSVSRETECTIRGLLTGPEQGSKNNINKDCRITLSTLATHDVLYWGQAAGIITLLNQQRHRA